MADLMSKEVYQDINIVITNNEIVYTNKKGVFRKPIKLTYRDIRQQLQDIGFVKPYDNVTYDSYYSYDLEHSNIPYFNFIYYYYFYKNLRIPSLSQLVNTYIRIHCDEIGENLYKLKPMFESNGITFTKEELTGRISRSICSFHREIDLFFQLREFEDLKLEYNFQKDLLGIDLTIECNGKKFYFASYVKTNRAFEWKEQKNQVRHVEDYSKYKMIDVVAVMNNSHGQVNCRVINNIKVYCPWFVEQKYNEIKKEAYNI